MAKQLHGTTLSLLRLPLAKSKLPTLLKRLAKNPTSIAPKPSSSSLAIQESLLTPHVLGVPKFAGFLRAVFYGSLTRGKHFHISVTDCVAAHASRVAKALTRDTLSKAFHVALFVGCDHFSNLVAIKIAPQLFRARNILYIFREKRDNANKLSICGFNLLESFENRLFQY